MALCIIGDIGGTNARFQLLEVHDAHSEILHQNVHPSKSYKNVYECLKAFMATAPIAQNEVKLAVLACAGLVHGNSCQVNNAGWPERTTAEKVQQETGVEKVIFINDLVAVGQGVASSPTGNLIQINGAPPPAPRFIIGLGTGLGGSLLIPYDGEYKCQDSEPGHVCSIVPKTQDEWIVYNYALNIIQTTDQYAHYECTDYVPAEILCANMGMVHAYYALKEAYPELIDLSFDSLLTSWGHPQRLIFEGARDGKPLCVKAIDVFMKFIGYAIGNLVCTVLPYGGVYLTGGIVQKNIKAFQQSKALYEGMYNQPRHIVDIIRRIPIYIIEDNQAFKGAESVLRKHLFPQEFKQVLWNFLRIRQIWLVKRSGVFELLIALCKGFHMLFVFHYKS